MANITILADLQLNSERMDALEERQSLFVVHSGKMTESKIGRASCRERV